MRHEGDTNILIDRVRIEPRSFVSYFIISTIPYVASASHQGNQEIIWSIGGREASLIW